jgi:hypothetical protein
VLLNPADCAKMLNDIALENIISKQACEKCLIDSFEI